MFGDAFPQPAGYANGFPDPFCDYTSVTMPRSWDDALRWCQFIYLRMPDYQEAIRRIVSFFITDITIEGRVSDKEKQEYKDFLHDKMGIMATLSALATDFMVYGTSVSSVVFPFRRFLCCPTPGCGFDAPFTEVSDPANRQRFNYEWKAPEFWVTCPHCKRRGAWLRSDRKGTSNDTINVTRWPPLELELSHCLITGRVGHIWKPPGYYQSHIRRGDGFQLATAPWKVVQAVMNNEYVQFHSDYVYHMAEPTVCGVPMRGWGFPRTLTHLPQVWYVQLLRRTNEAIGLDYVVPCRIITPAPNKGGTMADQSPIFGADMGNFTSRVMGMWAEHQRNPTGVHSLPFPIDFKVAGGEASQMVSEKLLDQGLDHLLNAVGLPQEMYRGTLTMQTVMPSMRMFMSNHAYLVYALNKFLAWVVKKISAEYSWDEVKVVLARPTHVDDLNQQLARAQLMAQGLVSQQAGLEPLGLDPKEEIDRKLEEQMYTAERTHEVEEEMAAIGIGDELAQGAPPPEGQAPQGGAAPAGQEGVPMVQDPVEAIMAMLPQGDDESVTPAEMDQIATSIAQMLDTLPEHLKDSALRQIKQQNEAIHALVQSKRESQKNQAKQEGVGAYREQMQQAGQQQATVGPQGPM
jgi:hypothetical protein